jgi:photosystem II stability/assembly factor-like uncharacterized protein
MFCGWDSPAATFAPFMKAKTATDDMFRLVSFLLLAFWLAPQLLAAQWQKVAALPTLYCSALHSQAGLLYVGSTDRVFVSSDNGLNWQESAPLPISDDEVTDLLVHGDLLLVATLLNGCFQSSDGGQSWAQINNGLQGLGSHNIAELALRDGVLYAGTIGAGVFARALGDAQPVWAPFNQNMPWGNIQSLSLDGDLLIAGAGGSATLALNQAGGSNWSEHSFDVFNGIVNIFLGAVRDGGHLIGAGTQGLYRSGNGGLQWEFYDIGLGLLERARFAPWQGQTVAMLSKPAASYLRQTADQGQNWAPFPESMPSGGIGFDLLAHGGRLFCARTDGLWVLAPTVPVATPDGSGSIEMIQIMPNPARAQVELTFQSKTAFDARFALHSLGGSLVSATTARIVPGSNLHSFDVSGLPPGHYFLRLENLLNGRAELVRLNVVR